MSNILVYGEALVDIVPTEQQPLAPLLPALGGGPFNAAIAASRLGGAVGFVSCVSNDHFGVLLHHALVDNGVDVSGVTRSDLPTSLAVTSLDKQGAASYTFYVEGTADRTATPVVPTALPRVAAVGTLSLALPPAAQRYIDCAKSLHEQGTLLVLDPNLRHITRTREHHDRLAALLPSVDVIKLSDEELDFFTPEELAQVPITVVTRGGAGLLVQTPHFTTSVTAPSITVADTIGAGDTVMGSLLVAFDTLLAGGLQVTDLTEQHWHTVLNFAASAAAVTCTRHGAQPPYRKEVAETWQQVAALV
ncbi:carbohydrate kinase [Corynebacterium choanae]|uniref:2-dehydro-3-deoxygluconokinase n=1 Tax=Corynebacterium choanae TaxID=1862358 RepID=A0A3G6J8E0_9CORY|nr:carbohydrate kinase [Corynebacterium choanae]AZA14371.1 2-dehydro-3-deoxygluconokinase [Corynebacterium choanae]